MGCLFRFLRDRNATASRNWVSLFSYLQCRPVGIVPGLPNKHVFIRCCRLCVVIGHPLRWRPGFTSGTQPKLRSGQRKNQRAKWVTPPLAPEAAGQSGLMRVAISWPE